MPNITITLPDSQLARLLAAAAAAGYPATGAGARQWILDWMRSTVRTAERRAAEAEVAAPAEFE